MTTIDDVRELIHRSWNTPDGAARILIAEQALAHAEALDDPDLAYAARTAATSAYHQGGEPMKAMMTFARCVADYDADPGRRDDNDERLLLWQFKFVTSAMVKFPDLPLDRTLAVLDDMQRRYKAGGHSQQAVYAYRHRVASHLGDTVLADHWYRMWDAAPRDRHSDCAGCDPTSKAYHHAWRGRDEEAIAVAEGALTGHLHCSEQPHGVLTALLLPYLRTGRLDDARDAHRRAYRALSDNKANLEDIAEHITFCGLTGNDMRGLELIERHLSWLEQSPTPKAEMEFAASATLVLRRLLESGQGELAVRRAGGQTTVTELGAALWDRAAALAGRFDTRNGNTFQGERIAALMTATPLVDYLPLSVTAAHRPSLPPAAPAPEPPVADLSDIAEDLGLDEQLDRVESLFQADDDARAEALAERILTRFGPATATASQRGRLARLRAMRAGRAETAVAAAAFAEAVDAFVEAGDRVREQATRVSWHFTQFELAGEARHVPAALAAMEQVLALSSDPDIRRNALVRCAFLTAVTNDSDQALTLIERAMAEPGQVSATRQARMHNLRAGVYQVQGRAQDSVDELRTAAELLRGQPPGDLLGGTLMSLAQALGAVGDNRGTFAAFEEAATVATDPDLRRTARANAGFMMVTSDRAAEFIDDIVEHVCVMEAEGETSAAAYTRHRLALALATVGRLPESAEVGEEALSWFLGQKSDDHQDIILELRDLLARVYATIGEPHVALGQLDTILEHITDIEQLPYRAHLQERCGELLWKLDRDAEAAQRFDAAAQAYGQADLPLATVHARRRQTLALHHSRQHPAALAALAQLDALLAVIEVPQDQQETLAWERATLGYEAVEVLTNHDDPDHAAALTRIAPVAGLFRSIQAFDEAAVAELRHGQVLILAGQPADAAAKLQRVLDELPSEHSARRDTAAWLARALDEIGENRKARKLRKSYDLPSPD